MAKKITVSRNPAYSEMIEHLYTDYTAYVNSEYKNGEGALSKRKFGDILTARGFEPKRGSGGKRLREGVMLRGILTRSHNKKVESVTQVTQLGHFSIQYA